MKNLQQQKFQFLRFSENRPNTDRYSVDVWDQDKIFLRLSTEELYALYIDLGLDNDEDVVAELYDLNSNKLLQDVHFSYQLTKKNGKHYFIFFFRKTIIDGDCRCLYFSFVTRKRKIYSNFFSLITDSGDMDRTTLLTFSHSENFYNANYYDNKNLPQQIRVPMYYSHDSTEVEAEQYQDSYRLENIYRTGKVKRLFFEDWKVLMNDSNYAPFSVAMDSDNIYFDKTYFNVKPFIHEEDSENKGFTISKLKAQRIAGKIFDDSIFGGVFLIKSDNITYNFEYRHDPRNTPLAGEQFLVNLLFINYTNFFGVVYECGLKAKIEEIPAKGKLYSHKTGDFISVGDFISYCDKDDLVYLPNGFENELGIQGNFTANFKYRIIDHLGNIGSDIMTQTINMTDLSEVVPVEISVGIVWGDDTLEDKSGELDGMLMKIAFETHDDNCAPLFFEWQREINGQWVSFDSGNLDITAIIFVGMNKFRAKLTDICGNEAISNILKYNKSSVTYTELQRNENINSCQQSHLSFKLTGAGIVNASITATFEPGGGSVHLTSNKPNSFIVDGVSKNFIEIGSGWIPPNGGSIEHTVDFNVNVSGSISFDLNVSASEIWVNQRNEQVLLPCWDGFGLDVYPQAIAKLSGLKSSDVTLVNIKKLLGN